MERLSLNGEWRFCPAKAAVEGGGRSYTLEVPGSWQETPGLEEYDGPGCYSRSFFAKPQPGSRAVLRFGGAYRRAEVFLNGARAGEHLVCCPAGCFAMICGRVINHRRIPSGRDSAAGPCCGGRTRWPL